MPELPEVETVRRGLAPVMEGVRIAQADVNRPDLRWPFPENMAARLTGADVVRLRRRSKYILADLSTKETLLIHLGMSGRMLVSGDKAFQDRAQQQIGVYVHAHPVAEKHDHVVFHMANGGRVTFNDPRRFGAMDLMVTADADAHPLLAVLGPEPLGNTFNESQFVSQIKPRNTPIKAALLDQKIVAGLGNIYVCEALFRTGIHPARRCKRISETRLASLVPVIRTVLSEAIEAGGSSLRDFRQADGELGYFQHSFDVYGREGQTCKTAGCGTEIKRLVQSGRSSFFCPNCQR